MGKIEGKIGVMKYTTELRFKDGKVRFEIANFL